LKTILKVLAPRFSRRRLILSILRDFRYGPSSLIGRLAAINFRNARVCAKQRLHCCICGYDGTMSYDFPDVRLRKAHGIGLLRETLRCKSCGGTMRDRQIAYGLLRVIAERSGTEAPDLRAFRLRQDGLLRILDTDAFSAINRTLRGMTGYVYSQYQPDKPNGSTLADGSVIVNLESMPFAGGNFDVILTSDVMEHVFDDSRAHQEIFRCLAPHGRYIFTVPFDPCIVGHRRLTQPTGDDHSYFLLEEHIHGDPHARTGIIAHRVYGRQLLDDMVALGYTISFANVERPDMGIFGGDLFIAAKGS
jgi:SAM-dependent methyltransferase